MTALHADVGRHANVLLLEDDDIDAKLVSLCAAMIPNIVLRIERATSSADARVRLSDGRFDLCIIDYWLGCESSLRFIAELDSRVPRVPALMLSSLSTPDIRAMCGVAGASVFLGKADLSATSLAAAVVKALDGACAAAPSAEGVQPGQYDRNELQAMSETMRFGTFERFCSAPKTGPAPKTGGRAPETRLVAIGDLILDVVDYASALLDDRDQTVTFQKPRAVVNLRCDPARCFFLIFELLSRTSGLSAKGSALRIDLNVDGSGIVIIFQGGKRIDATAGALALGPLCAEMLAADGAAFTDTSDSDGGFRLMVCLQRKGHRCLEK